MARIMVNCVELTKAYKLGYMDSKLFNENTLLFARMLDELIYNDFQEMRRLYIQNCETLERNRKSVQNMQPLEKIVYTAGKLKSRFFQ